MPATENARAQEQDPFFPRVSLPGTELRPIHSEAADTDYMLYVALPASYTADATKTYPVLYCVDANIGFAAITQMYRGFIMTGEVSEMILVGIGYPTESLGEFFERRHADMVPQGEQFMRVILEDIIPYVEAEFRTSGDRAFAGYSRGGLFAMYLLLHATETFGDYVIGSPVLGWGASVDDNDPNWWRTGTMFVQEAAHAATHDDLDARVFFSYCSLEDPSIIGSTAGMVATLSKRGYSGLELELAVFEGETHMSGSGHWLSRLPRFVFQPSKQ